MTTENGNGLGELAAALTKAQTAFPKIVKDKTAKVPTKSGGEYSYRYADLATLIEAVRKPLAENGLAFVQLMDVGVAGAAGQQYPVLLTRLLHTGGGSLESRYPMLSHDRPQEMGSEITYARRYTLSALLGVASEDDDDGAAAQGGGSRGKSQPRAAQEPTKAPIDPDPVAPFDYEPEQADPRPRFLKGDLTCPNCKDRRRVFKRKDGTKWFCPTDRGGCGGQWTNTTPVAPTIDTSTGEVLNRDPMAMDVERKALLLKVGKLSTDLGFKSAERAAHWKTYCGTASEENVGPSALQDLVRWLETRAAAKSA